MSSLANLSSEGFGVRRTKAISNLVVSNLCLLFYFPFTLWAQSHQGILPREISLIFTSLDIHHRYLRLSTLAKQAHRR